MTGPESVEWRRSVPSARLGALAWYVFGAAAVLGLVWLLFGGERARLDSGQANPLALAVPGAVTLTVLVGVPMAMPVLRRPVVAANHYALTVRPGWWRTLVLPWVKVSGVAAYRVGGDPYLLVRCHRSLDPRRDLPGWFDQGPLRLAMRRRRRGDPPIGDYDLAVRMDHFVGGSSALLATLAAFAPDHVAVDNELAEA